MTGATFRFAPLPDPSTHFRLRASDFAPRAFPDKSGYAGQCRGHAERLCLWVDSEPSNDMAFREVMRQGIASNGDRSMGAMRKNAKKKAKQRAHAEKRKAQEQASAVASVRDNAGGSKRPMGRAA